MNCLSLFVHVFVVSELTKQTHYTEHWQCDRQHAVRKLTPTEEFGSNGTQELGMTLCWWVHGPLDHGDQGTEQWYPQKQFCENLISCKEVGISMEGPSMYQTHTDWLILVRKSYVYN